MSTLAESVKGRLRGTGRLLKQLKTEPRLDMIGRVERVGDNIASVRGLPDARLGELLLFERSDGGEPVVGIVLSLDPDLIGCAMLGDDSAIGAGNLVRATGSVASVPVGDKLLGRVVNALGVPMDGGPEIEAAGIEPVERPAPAIVDRDFVNTPLNTGLLVIDAMLPLGRGQRELIIGDRETGKTAIAIDTIINQRESGVICIYCAVGQKTSSVSQVVDAVKLYGAPERCIFVFAPADDPPGIQWLAPYAACTMAEYFSERGGDALLIIDDLSKHAIIYRQLSLLLRNPPGREAYPGDIFYIHSRLLERAAKLNHERGGGSLTALPIAATEEGNLSAYIPTNLISITDGQIVLEPRLFHEGQKPAVNVGKSVSRVGGKTRSHAMRKLADNLRLEYAQFLELEIFTRFGGMVDERTQAIIEHGRRIRAVLTQPQFAPLSVAHQVALLVAIDERLLDQLPLDKVRELQAQLGSWLNEHAAEPMRQVNTFGELEPGTRAALVTAIGELVQHLIPWELHPQSNNQMAQEREIASRIASLRELREIVAAIRAMAATQMQQALRSQQAIRSYSEQIRGALSDATTLLPSVSTTDIGARPNQSGLVLFCAEHGLCGGFNEHPLRAAEAAMAASDGGLMLIVVGTRGAQICRERGLSPDLILPMATHCAGVTGAARRVAAELYRMFGARRIAGVEVVFAQHAGAQFPRIERQRLLPLELSMAQKTSSRLPPIINLQPQRLFDDIVGEYFFATLENAAIQSFFSENSTRFHTMEAAHQNIQNKSGELTKLMQRLRQESVTTEILDVIGGSAAIPTS